MELRPGPYFLENMVCISFPLPVLILPLSCLLVGGDVNVVWWCGTRTIPTDLFQGVSTGGGREAILRRGMHDGVIDKQKVAVGVAREAALAHNLPSNRNSLCRRPHGSGVCGD